jgi:hypothetical protein
MLHARAIERAPRRERIYTYIARRVQRRHARLFSPHLPSASEMLCAVSLLSVAVTGASSSAPSIADFPQLLDRAWLNDLAKSSCFATIDRHRLH